MDTGDTASLDSAVELRGEDTQFDPATYVASAIFNSVAFPPNMPDYLRRHIEAEAAFAQRLDDAGVTIGGANGGPIGEKTKAQRQKEKADEAFEIMTAQFEERREQERQEWARTPSTVAGVTMTGKEWADLSERLRTDEDLHRRLLEVFRARGMSEEEAEARYDRVTAVAEIAAIPPSQRTEEQRETIHSAEADPTFKHDVADAHKAANDLSTPASGLTQTFSSAHDGAASVSDKQAAPAVVQAPKPIVQVPSAGM